MDRHEDPMAVSDQSDLNLPDQREVLASIPLFGDLKEDVVDWVLSRCRTARVASGEWFDPRRRPL